MNHSEQDDDTLAGIIALVRTSGDDEDDFSDNDVAPAVLQARAKRRESFIQACLRVANNDATLVNLDDWHDAIAVASLIFNSAMLRLMGHCLTNNTHLQSLTITTNVCTCNNNNVDMVVSSQESANAIGHGIAHSQLRELTLDGLCGRCPLHTSIFDGVANSPSLQQLEWRCHSGKEYMNVPSIAPFLFGVPDNAVSPSPCQLTQLTLTSFDFHDRDMQNLSMALADNRHLLSLNLQNNVITDEGIRLFCEHWSADSPLQELNLTRNDIGLEGAVLLLQETARHPAMRKLVLDCNNLDGHIGMERIGRFLPHVHNLQHLSFQTCCLLFSRVGTDERDAAVRVLADGLRQNRSLLELHVGNNHLSARGVELLMQAVVAHRPHLETLSLENDLSFKLAGVKHIAKYLPDTRLKRLYLDGTLRDWREPDPPNLVWEAEQAMYQGVQNSPELTEFRMIDLSQEWLIPILFYVEWNKTCRPLMTSQVITPAVWPHVMVNFQRRNRIGFIYFSLREQPWLVR
jgi:hypothetical protein